MKKILFVILVLFHSCLHAQIDLTMSWYDIAESNEESMTTTISMAHDDSNNLYVLLGNRGEIALADSTAFIPNVFWLYKYFIVKYNSSGALMWKFPVFENGTMHPNALDVHGNGDVYVCGDIDGIVDLLPGAPSLLVGTEDINQWFVIKYSTDGDFQWIKGADGHPDADPIANQIVVGESHIYLAGTYENFIDLDPGEDMAFTDAFISYERNLFILKLTLEGNYVWSRASKEGTNCVTNDLEVDEETDQIALSAKCYSGLDTDFTNGTFELPTGTFYNGFVSRYSLDGQFISCYHMDNQSPLYQPIAVAFNNSGDLLMSCSINFNTTLQVNNTQTFISTEGADCLIAKVSPLGFQQWYHTLSGENPKTIQDIAPVGTETYIAGGINADSILWDNVELTQSVESGNEAFFFRLDESGMPIGFEIFGGAEYEIINELSYSGSLLTLGIEFESAIPNCPWLPIEEPGNIDNIFITFGNVVSTHEFDLREMHIYPNPSHGSFLLNLPSTHDDLEITLFDLSGRCVFFKHFSQNSSLLLSLEDKQGVFILQAKSENALYTQKVVIE